MRLIDGKSTTVIFRNKGVMMLAKPKKKNMRKSIFGLNHYLHYISNNTNYNDEVESFFIMLISDIDHTLSRRPQIMREAIARGENVDKVMVDISNQFYDRIIDHDILMRSIVEYVAATSNSNMEEMPEDLAAIELKKLYPSDIICLICLGVYMKIVKLFEAYLTNINRYSINRLMGKIDGHVARITDVDWFKNTLDSIREFTEGEVGNSTAKNVDILEKFEILGTNDETLVSSIIDTSINSMYSFIPRLNIADLENSMKARNASKEEIKIEIARAEKAVEDAIIEEVVHRTGLDPKEKDLLYLMNEDFYPKFSYSDRNLTGYLRAVIGCNINNKTVLKTVHTRLATTDGLPSSGSVNTYENFISKFDKNKEMDIEMVVNEINEELTRKYEGYKVNVNITSRVLSTNNLAVALLDDYLETYSIDSSECDIDLVGLILLELAESLTEKYPTLSKAIFAECRESGKKYIDDSMFRDSIHYKILGEMYINRIVKLLSKDYIGIDHESLVTELAEYLRTGGCDVTCCKS